MTIRHIVFVLLCTLFSSTCAFAAPSEVDKTTKEPAAASVAQPSAPAPAPAPPPAPVPGQQAVSPAPVVERSYDKEIHGIREQIAATPSEAILHVRLGYLLLKKGAPDEARLSFAEALKLNPKSHAALTGEGIVQSGKGNLKEAEKTLRAALAQNPDPVRAHYELGVVYEKLGDLDKALLEYKEAIRKHEQGRK